MTLKKTNKIVLVITLAALAATMLASDFVFERVQPLIYLRAKNKVILGTAEYDINFAYANPCYLFEKNVKASLAPGD